DQSYYDQDNWRGTWQYDGGVLSNQASHHIDMLTWFMGDVESVHSRAATALVDIEAEDQAVLLSISSSRSLELGIFQASSGW
ncbi:Gfo/Idh/MocA family oxidoreductase, partial [Rhizobium johnstonii]|uniref:Gfo/Idh/MocA family protein n=1 Tax=Rhizobium johnstonii TaxID=3019933 RepID=UPI003F97ED8C